MRLLIVALAPSASAPVAVTSMVPPLQLNGVALAARPTVSFLVALIVLDDPWQMRAPFNALAAWSASATELRLSWSGPVLVKAPPTVIVPPVPEMLPPLVENVPVVVRNAL